MDLRDAIERRRSIKGFDPDHVLSDEELRALIEPVLLSPTSFNLQHWRIVAVRDKATQKQLCEAAYGQPQVADCSVTLVITAKLTAHEDAARVWRGAPEPVVNSMVQTIESFYGGEGQLQRDEAVRSGGIASMTLMLVAVDMGLDSCPMIGFDPAKVRAILGVPDDHISVLMLCVGKAIKPAFPRVGRLSLDDVLRLDRFDGDAL